jgi:hypothetical protein
MTPTDPRDHKNPIGRNQTPWFDVTRQQFEKRSNGKIMGVFFFVLFFPFIAIVASCAADSRGPTL